PVKRLAVERLTGSLFCLSQHFGLLRRKLIRNLLKQRGGFGLNLSHSLNSLLLLRLLNRVPQVRNLNAGILRRAFAPSNLCVVRTYLSRLRVPHHAGLLTRRNPSTLELFDERLRRRGVCDFRFRDYAGARFRNVLQNLSGRNKVSRRRRFDGSRPRNVSLWRGSSRVRNYTL